MSAVQIVSKARAMKVRLWIDGDIVKMAGPTEALAVIKPEIAEHKAEIIAHLRDAANNATDCDGALIHPKGGAYLPWGPYLSADDVQRMRGELAGLIETIRIHECWTPERYGDVVWRAMQGPLSDLLPNLNYFRSRMADIEAEEEMRALLRQRVRRSDRNTSR